MATSLLSLTFWVGKIIKIWGLLSTELDVIDYFQDYEIIIISSKKYALMGTKI